MGICNKKPEEEDIETGLTRTDTRLLRKTWRYYCVDNRDYAVIIFLSFFIKSRGALELFRRFRDKPLGKLPDDPQFRAHAVAVSFQLTSMVDTADDAVLLEALIRKNARAHTERHGVMPDHFRMLGRTVVEVLHARNERRMTPPAVRAWEKLFDYMARITKQVYEEEKVQVKSVDIDGFTRELDADVKEGGTGGSASSSGTPQSRGKRSPKDSQPPAKSSRGTAKGGQSRAAATPKGSQSSAAATPKGRQSSAAATPKVGQSRTAATPNGGQSRAAAAYKRGQSSAAAAPKGGLSPAAATPKGGQSPAAATPKGGLSPAAATPRGGQSSAAATPKGGLSPAAATPKDGQSPAAATPKGGLSPAAATPKGGQSSAAATPKGGQSPAAATPKGGLSPAAATPKGGQSSAAATPKGGQLSVATTPKGGQSLAAVTPKGYPSPGRVRADKSPANSPQWSTTPKKAT